MRVRLHAAYVLPIDAPPVRDGWVDVEDGRIVARGEGRPGTPPPGSMVLDLGRAVVMPALVNAHTHLELSHLRGRVAPAGDFIAWVTAMLAAREGSGPPASGVIADAIREAVRSGTAAFGDIGNTDAAIEPLQAAHVDAWHFHELIGFRGGRGAEKARRAWELADARAIDQGARQGRVRFGVAPHAPYSTAPDLMAGIVARVHDAGERRSSIHLGESPEELQLLAEGTGPWRALLEAFGTWDPEWPVPGCGPVGYLQRNGALHPGVLLVHGTQLATEELRLVAASGATLVLCVRSNRWVGAGVPPIEAAVAAGVRLALGTDSLASVESLNLFDELGAAHAAAPEVPPSVLLRAATHGGAEALGFAHLGTLAPGRAARMLAVSLPPGPHETADIERWLVSGGVTPDDVRWVDEQLASLAVTEGAAS